MFMQLRGGRSLAGSAARAAPALTRQSPQHVHTQTNAQTDTRTHTEITHVCTCTNKWTHAYTSVYAWPLTRRHTVDICTLRHTQTHRNTRSTRPGRTLAPQLSSTCWVMREPLSGFGGASTVSHSSCTILQQCPRSRFLCIVSTLGYFLGLG